jgi:hypothetical protein
MFGKLMAVLTKRYEVVKMIGFFVSLYAIDSEGDLVVNIKFPSQLFARCAAMLASVVVAFTRFAALRIPVWAVIGKLSALPQMIIWARFIGRQPKAKALNIAKITMFVEVLRHHIELSAALPTTRRYAVVVRAIRARGIGGFPFAPARAATKMVRSRTETARPTCERYAALCAGNIGTVVMDAVRASIQALIASVGAFATAVIFLVATKLALFAAKLLTAFRTSQVAVPNKSCCAAAFFAWNTQAVAIVFCGVKVFRCGGVIVAALRTMFHLDSPYWPYRYEVGKAVRLAFRAVHEAVLSLTHCTTNRGIYA